MFERTMVSLAACRICKQNTGGCYEFVKLPGCRSPEPGILVCSAKECKEKAQHYVVNELDTQQIFPIANTDQLVTVQRSSGDIENDWNLGPSVLFVSEMNDWGIQVSKGHLGKCIPKTEFIKLNPTVSILYVSTPHRKFNTPKM